MTYFINTNSKQNLTNEKSFLKTTRNTDLFCYIVLS